MDYRMHDEKVVTTFFLITYNQEKYIREAIKGAFSQTYSPLEIVISDDCSTDGTFRIIEEMCEKYDGQHKIVVNQNRYNLGLIGHINRITELSSGELIIYAAGDDISLPHRTAKLVERYLATDRKASLLHSSVYLIDIAGNRVGTRHPPVISHGINGMSLEDMALSGALIIGATSAFTRKIEETFGPITYSKCVEDLVMGFRSALTGSLEYIPEPLILYRHDSGITSRVDSRSQTYKEYIKSKIRGEEGYLAVLAQRIDDLKTIGEGDLIPLIKRKRTEVLLKRTLWTRKYSFIKLVSYSYKRCLFGVFVRLLLLEKKKRILFYVKKLMHTSRVNS